MTVAEAMEAVGTTHLDDGSCHDGGEERSPRPLPPRRREQHPPPEQPDEDDDNSSKSRVTGGQSQNQSQIYSNCCLNMEQQGREEVSGDDGVVVSSRDGKEEDTARVVVVGGGIAGVCCARELATLLSQPVALLTAGQLLKDSHSVLQVTETLEEVAVYEQRAEVFQARHPQVEVLSGVLERVNTKEKKIVIRKPNNSDNNEKKSQAMPTNGGQESNDGMLLSYDLLCLCTGAKPSLILPQHPRIIGLRDMETVDVLCKRLASSRRVVVVGNGGIALELIHALLDFHVVWIVRENYIGHSFFDASASKFIMPTLESRIKNSETLQKWDTNCEASKPTFAHNFDENSGYDGGVGPEWLRKSDLINSVARERKRRREEDAIDQEPSNEFSEAGSLRVEYEQEIRAIKELGSAMLGDSTLWKAVGNWPPLSKAEQGRAEDLLKVHLSSVSSGLERSSLFPLYLLTSQDKIVGCDFVVSATGVTPNTSYLSAGNSNDSSEIACSPSGEILVDEALQTSAVGVFAAGDCCQVYLDSKNEGPRHWFQMKLWSQARSMGIYAAHCMAAALQTVSHESHELASQKQIRRLKTEDYEIIYGHSMFESFAHVTHFFGHKVVLLGRFNAQGLGSDVEKCTREVIISKDGLQRSDRKGLSSRFRNTSAEGSSNSDSDLEIWTRVTPGEEYIKVTVLRGKVVGALLIGDTDLEEVFENLILNGLDVSAYGVHILSPELDLEDFFD